MAVATDTLWVPSGTKVLGYVDASDAEGAKAAAATQFDLDEVRRNRIMVQELG